MTESSGRLAFVALVFCASLSACSAPGGPGSFKLSDWGLTPDGGASDAPAPVAVGRCLPARGSEALPARATAMTSEVTAAGPTTMFTRDLYNLFKSYCGACHVETKLGNFQVDPFSFSKLVDQKVVALIKQEDVALVMPPPPTGKAFSQRTPGDPLVELVNLLQTWIDQGRPDAIFTLPSLGSKTGVSPYLLSEALGHGMTNIGNCVPERNLVGSGAAAMDKMDTFFAEATALPDTLSETDLSTLDGTLLARDGVIAYAPAYPLWTDNSGKLRHIRVPRGQSVKFHKDSQTFDIPPNTRFYKTFLKPVIDVVGNPTYRKIETRVIVSRPDRRKADGTFETTALFGTYKWNDEETEAVLERAPLRNGKPFADHLFTYQLDEQKVKEVLDANPPDPRFALEEENPGLLRHYAIPGSERCIQCHMGSPSASFVLGFFPLQVARRPAGVAGVIEPTGEDEMTQLQRFIDYGLITGMASPADVVPLDQSQGTRKPRNEHELKAQAYVLGNCAHCHNPRGFPSVKSPELKDLLDFMPSATGGIFEFPLDRFSPLRQRGRKLDVPIPYITPSLRDYPVLQEAGKTTWAPKHLDCSLEVSNFCGDTKLGTTFFDAPWRSLVYRNVDTPFAYADDFAIFPHMPMHSPGFDCRAPRILGDWMVSIPAVRKSAVDENNLPRLDGQVPVDDNPQPFVEVKAGDPRYAEAVEYANYRMRTYHTGGRYEFCPDTSDIVDRAVLNRRNKGDPLVPVASVVLDPKDLTKVLQPDLGVPVRSHWVVTDLTEPPGDWFPRRPDWDAVLVKGQLANSGLSGKELEEQTALTGVLRTVSISERLRAYATTEAPYAQWEQKSNCDFSAIPKASSFTGDQRPRWLDKVAVGPTAPVYTLSPGAAVFSTICINCHGPQADSSGLYADNVLNVTGGDARVANLRDGIFGPPAMSGGNIMRVFGATSMGQAGVSAASDWAGRYVAWMALGGTQRVIPTDILNIVAATSVFGKQRSSNRISPEGSPNMLKLAEELCSHVLPANGNVTGVLDSEFFASGALSWGDQTGLIDTIGDAEMWLRLCSLDNRPVVRVPYVAKWTSETGSGQQPLRIDATKSLYWGDGYPSDAPVLTDRSRIAQGIRPDNAFPLCIRKPSDPGELLIATKFLESHPVGGAGGVVIPYCPETLFDPSNLLKSSYDRETSKYDLIDAKKWATRGAINAGLSVFLYLEQLSKGTKAKPSYNHCEQLGRAN